MDDSTLDKFKTMLNNGNIPSELQNIISNMNTTNKNTDSSTKSNGISPETINNLVSMLNSNTKSSTKDSDNTNSNEHSTNSNSGIDFETIMKFKTIMDKINSKDDPRSKLLTSLKPYLKDSRKSKVDQYIQFLNMSKVIDIFSKSLGFILDNIAIKLDISELFI